MLPILISTAAAAAIAAGFWDFGGITLKDQRVPSRCTASLWVTSLGTRIQCGGTLSLLPSGTDSLVVCGRESTLGATIGAMAKFAHVTNRHKISYKLTV